MDKALILAQELKTLRERVAAIVSTPTPTNGLNGLQGAIGASGKQGLAGLKGLDGKAGKDGKDGVAGLHGISIKSAEVDFDGTLSIQMSDGSHIKTTTEVVGATGARGVPGAQGLIGDTGLKGLTGATGATGSQGAAGVAGATGAQGIAGTNGSVRLTGYTVATLPTGIQGDKAFVTNALVPIYMVTVAGGGGVVTEVFHNGTNWVCS